jgi:hypothetical protein
MSSQTAEGEKDPERPQSSPAAWHWRSNVHPSAWATIASGILFGAVFGYLSVQKYEDFGLGTLDLGLYGLFIIGRG